MQTAMHGARVINLSGLTMVLGLALGCSGSDSEQPAEMVASDSPSAGGSSNVDGGAGSAGTSTDSGSSSTTRGASSGGTTAGDTGTAMGGSSGTASDGAAGSGGTSTDVDMEPSDTQCGTLCAKIIEPQCEAVQVTQSECEAACEAPVDVCQAELAEENACAATEGTVSCVEGGVTLEGCDDQILASIACQVCAPADGDTACGGCDKQNCCDELVAIATSVDTFNLDQCVSGCTDQACADDCIATYPAGVEIFEAGYACEQQQCATECICAASADDDACFACAKANCCAELVAFNTATDTADLESCVSSCADDECVDACFEASPVASAAYDEIDACAAGDACQTECQVAP